MKRKLPTVVYGGFVNDKLDFVEFLNGDPTTLMPALFKTRKFARERYEDVRRIVIDKENPNG